MTDVAPEGDYGMRTAADTIELKRLLPGPIERVWAYLTESDCGAAGSPRARWGCRRACRSS